MESLFDHRLAEGQLRSLHRKGPQRTTSILLGAILDRGVSGRTLLDIGGGVGAIPLRLLAAGAAHATAVDASSAYLAVARAEALRQGLSDRVHALHGDFVRLAPGVPPADVVTLDRVICCSDDMPALLAESAARALRVFGLVYPRSAWWTRVGVRLLNLNLWLRGNPFRVFVHPTELVESILAGAGLSRTFHRRSGMWQVAIFEQPHRRHRPG
jgi:magnesium-protoporphyrin O-methyltransferase